MNTPHIYSFGGKKPRIHAAAYVHPSACIIGDVDIGANCFVGPHATLRGDHGPIRLDEMSNVQDNCVLHSCPGGAVLLHRGAQVGHGAVLHGCELLENCLVGINATLLDEAVVGRDCIVAAHALVTKGFRLQGGALYAGTPAKFVKALSQAAIKALRDSAQHYADVARDYRNTCRRVAAIRYETALDAASMPVATCTQTCTPVMKTPRRSAALTAGDYGAT